MSDDDHGLQVSGERLVIRIKFIEGMVSDEFRLNVGFWSEGIADAFRSLAEYPMA